MGGLNTMPSASIPKRLPEMIYGQPASYDDADPAEKDGRLCERIRAAGECTAGHDEVTARDMGGASLTVVLLRCLAALPFMGVGAVFGLYVLWLLQ